MFAERYFFSVPTSKILILQLTIHKRFRNTSISNPLFKSLFEKDFSVPLFKVWFFAIRRLSVNWFQFQRLV
jgi:hypothetical protein